jgi:hypothetical protein
MSGFESTLLWFLLALLRFITGFLLQASTSALWLFRPLAVASLVIATAQPAEAGWLSWLWGSNTRQLERSLDVAQEAARVASHAADAQARNAAAHAEQNARLAETLGKLSSERTNLANHNSALSELGLKDSQWAAAINASAPVLVCITVLLVAGLALWLAARSGASQQAELAETVDLLVEEIAEQAADADGPYGARDGSLQLGHYHRHRTPALVGYAGDREARGHDEGASDENGPMPF